MTTPLTPTCQWTSTTTPRTLKHRHLDDCNNDTCRGCLPCPDRHCQICGINHLDHDNHQTCPTCIAATRTDLANLDELQQMLPDHALNGGNDGRLEAARPIPGGEAMVMLMPGSETGEAAAGDHLPTEVLLNQWAGDWATYDATISDPNAYGWLEQHLTWAAHHHPAYPDFVTEIRRHVAYLEDILHAGHRTETGAPCDVCHRPLERKWAANARDDAWWCERCKIVVRPEEYVQQVSAEARRHGRWLTARDMEAEHRIKPGSLRGWASSGRVAKKRDANLSRMVYSVADALACRDDAHDTQDATA